MDIPADYLDRRSQFVKRMADSAKRVQAARDELDAAFAEQGVIGREWFDWEQTVAKPLSKEVE